MREIPQYPDVNTVGPQTMQGPLTITETVSDIHHAVTKEYADGIASAISAAVYKGEIACAGNPNYPAATAGWFYKVSSAGKIGGAAGVDVQIGDMLYCLVTSLTGDHAAVGAGWNISQFNIRNSDDLSEGATNLYFSAAKKASVSDVNTGNSVLVAVTPDALAGSYAGTGRMNFDVIFAGATMAVGDGEAGGFVVPAEMNGMNLLGPAAGGFLMRHATADNAVITTIALKKTRKSDGVTVDMLATSLTIDVNEKDNYDPATPYSLSATPANYAIATGDYVYPYVSQVGVVAMGLKGHALFQLP